MNVLDGIPEEKLSLEQERQCVVAKDFEKLVIHNLIEGFSYGKGSYQSRGLSDGEILSACYSGLLSAAKNFRPGGLRFFAYAKQSLRGALSREIRNLDVVKRAGTIEPLPAEVEDDEDDTTPPSFVQPFVQPLCLPAFDAISLREEWARLEPLLRKALNDFEFLVVSLHYSGNLNLQQIANLRGVSRAFIQYTKERALKKIRRILVRKNWLQRE